MRRKIMDSLLCILRLLAVARKSSNYSSQGADVNAKITMLGLLPRYWPIKPKPPTSYANTAANMERLKVQLEVVTSKQ